MSSDENKPQVTDKDFELLKDIGTDCKSILFEDMFSVLAKFLIEQQKINAAMIGELQALAQELELIKKAHNGLVTDLEFLFTGGRTDDIDPDGGNKIIM
jgi:hypothetical protein